MSGYYVYKLPVVLSVQFETGFSRHQVRYLVPEIERPGSNVSAYILYMREAAGVGIYHDRRIDDWKKINKQKSENIGSHLPGSLHRLGYIPRSLQRSDIKAS